MPTYVYRREDGTTFEIQQRITEDPLDACPETGQPVKRLITGSAGLIFKGDGFYVNDYKSSNGAASANGSDASGDGASDAADASPSSASGAADGAASGAADGASGKASEAASDASTTSK